MEADAETLPSVAAPAGASAKAAPSSFEEVIAWPDVFARDLFSHNVSNVSARLRQPLLLTTHYSGIRSAELCVRMLQERFKTNWARLYSAGPLPCNQQYTPARAA